MDTRSSTIIVFTALALVAGFPAFVFSVPVHTYGGDFYLPIVDEPGRGGELTEAIIDIPDHYTIYDLDVRINITHTNVFDLQLFLKGPQGPRICLNYFDELAEYDIYPNYTDTTFDDEAQVPIENGAAPFTGRFKPRGPGKLEDFIAKDTHGTWRLEIYDMFDWDYGTLDSFELVVTVPEPATALLLTLGMGLIGRFGSRRRR
jgi:subtilisin-like proprotein convertase family protein